MQAIVSEFSVGTLQKTLPIHVGLIHQTYKVITEEACYCLQGLHHKLGTDEILTDYENVLAHLSNSGFPAPRLIKTKANKSFFEDAEGTRWRMISWLDGESHSSVHSTYMARSGACLLGRFHSVMSEYKGVFLSKHPLHKTSLHLEKMNEAYQANIDSPWAKKMEDALHIVKEKLPALLLPELPVRVVHGDPKISNILFDKEQNALAMIDLDTCNHHSVLVDLGDAVRSWCRDGSEDLLRPFALDKFQALIEGYADSGFKLHPDEIAYLPKAGLLITYELTSRFLADVLDDNYFGWDQKKYSSRREHNLARSKGMLYLAEQMEEAQEEIEQIVAKAFKL